MIEAGTDLLRGELTPAEVNQIIIDYFRDVVGLDITTGDPSMLRYIVSTDNNSYGYFHLDTDFQGGTFNLANNDILLIMKRYFAAKDYELVSGLGYNDGTGKFGFSYRKSNTIRHEMEDPAKKFIPSIEVRTSLPFITLDAIIRSYYKKVHGIEITCIGLEYLRSNLVYSTSTPHNVYTRTDEFGVTPFPITKDDVEEIFSEYLAEYGYKFLSAGYDNDMGFTFTIREDYKEWKDEQAAAARLGGTTPNLEDAAEELAAAKVVMPTDSPEEASHSKFGELNKGGETPAPVEQTPEVPVSPFTPEQEAYVRRMFQIMLEEVTAKFMNKEQTQEPQQPTSPFM